MRSQRQDRAQRIEYLGLFPPGLGLYILHRNHAVPPGVTGLGVCIKKAVFGSFLDGNDG
jgi:hypothetical protein